MLCPNVSAKSLRVLPRSFEVASFDVDVFSSLRKLVEAWIWIFICLVASMAKGLR